VLRAKVCRSGHRLCALVAATLFLGLLPADIRAQETRADETAKKQQEKAATDEAYKPSAVERFLTSLERSYTSPPSGFFPFLGSIYPGGGFTLGAGYRQFYAREAIFEVKGLYSIKNYKQIEIGTRSNWNNSGKWMTGLRGGFLDATQVGYYGLGFDTLRGDRANFRVKQVYGIGTIAARPTNWIRLEGETGYEDFKNEEGLGRAPSIETVYDSITAPALFVDTKYLHTQGTAAIDWRTSPGYTRRGGYYGVTLHDYADRDDTFSFRRVDGELIQHLPILRENWVLSFRGRMQSILDDADQVPYFLMPYIGSGSTLRAYPTGRFRDRHTLLTSAEFRWIANRLALDMALFFDAGKVANRREDLDFNDLKTDWGIGMRFHGPAATPLRLEAAKGADGWRLIITSGAAF
jgi:outer membrane protein assembly factor BamA